MYVLLLPSLGRRWYCKEQDSFTSLEEALLLLLLSLLIAFDEDRCYEPFLAHGNFSTSDPLYRVGTVVEFACSAGYMLEQGPSAIECIDSRDPRWNESEPTCKGNPPSSLTLLCIL